MSIMDIHKSYSFKMNLTRHICEIIPKNYWMNVIVSLGLAQSRPVDKVKNYTCQMGNPSEERSFFK